MGSDMVVYNIHNVVHLADDSRKYSSLNNIQHSDLKTFGMNGETC